MTLALAEALRREAPLGEPATRLCHRSVAPLFCGQPAAVSTAATGAGHVVAQLRRGGDLCSRLEVEPVA